MDTKPIHPGIEDMITELLNQRKMPESGWSIRTIEYLLSYLSSMDSNNFINKASVGEREGRCFSDLVSRRNYHFSHGIGRSGDLTEPQPKAVGSSILYKLTNMLLKDLMTNYDINLESLLVPIPVGISLILCLNTFRSLEKPSKYIIWFREDNETIFKAIVNGGFIPVILDPISKLNNCGNKLDVLLEKINIIDAKNISSIISSTNCSLPREADDIRSIAEICKKYNIAHIIINENGLQNTETIFAIKETYKTGRIDVILQDASGNFLIPTGSTLLTSCHTNIIENISKTYPGRASSSSVIDIFITLLSLGKKGYRKLLYNKEHLCAYLREELLKLCDKTLITKLAFNSATIALSFSDDIASVSFFKGLIHSDTNIKSHLVTSREDKILFDYKFKDWGTHGFDCQIPFITFTLNLYTSLEEINYLLNKINTFFNKL